MRRVAVMHSKTVKHQDIKIMRAYGLLQRGKIVRCHEVIHIGKGNIFPLGIADACIARGAHAGIFLSVCRDGEVCTALGGGEAGEAIVLAAVINEHQFKARGGLPLCAEVSEKTVYILPAVVDRDDNTDHFALLPFFYA